MRPLFDTNILIDSVRGVTAATDILNRYADRTISIISWIEVLAGSDPTKEHRTRIFLSRFEVVKLDDQIIEEAVLIRRTRRLKLPDAIIWATARSTGRTLITRDAKDFPADDPGIHIPYRLP